MSQSMTTFSEKPSQADHSLPMTGTELLTVGFVMILQLNSPAFANKEAYICKM